MTQIIDIETIINLKQALKKDVFSSLVNIYITDTETYVLNLKQCINENNAIEAHRLAHTIRGSSANMGARALQEICETVEQLCKLGHLQDAKNHIDSVQTISQQTLTEIRNLGD
jgi:HPt (histidine-containing phosphotransfer) domain-containing protein